MKKIEYRLFQQEDVVGLVELINRSVGYDRIGQPTTIQGLNEWLDEPGEEIRENTFVATDEGNIIGYNALCFVKGDRFINVYSYGTVDPIWRRKGIGTHLVECSIKHLHDRSQKDNIKIIYNQMVRTDIQGQNELAKKCSFNKLTDILSFRCSKINMSASSTAKDGYYFRAPSLKDASDWASIYNDAFSWRPNNTDLAVENIVYEFNGQQYSPEYYMLCTNENNESIGFISSYVENNQGVISTIAVRRKYQGLGIGKVLFNEVMYRMKENGIHEVRLSVDSQNPTSAIQLYKKSGFTLDKRIIHYTLNIEPYSKY